jgi:hypothetical protein
MYPPVVVENFYYNATPKAPPNPEYLEVTRTVTVPVPKPRLPPATLDFGSITATTTCCDV